MLQTQAGTLVPASTQSKVQGDPKKFLLVLQYFNGDKEQMENLASLIADLERVRNKDVDVLVFSRTDASMLSPDTIKKLESKFNSVVWMRCTRKDAKGYPFGSNGMFYELVTMFGQQPRWYDRYFAFLNLEPDCCPMGPGWLTRLIQGFREAENQGFHAIGHVHSKPIDHMNGVAVYSIDIWRRVPGGALGGGNPTIPFDLRHAKNLLPLAQNTPLIYFEYQKTTITPEELFQEPKGAPLSLFHGVKDESAREAVRARYITFSSEENFSRRSVFTFYNPKNEANGEEKALLALWRDGWISRGWNPVVLRISDAMKNGRYAAYRAEIEKLPFIGDKFDAMNVWLRWIALDTVGGGLFSAVNVLPAALVPPAVSELNGLVRLSETNELFYADKRGTSQWIDLVLGYSLHEDDVKNGKPCVSDETVLNRSIDQVQQWSVPYGSENYLVSPAVVFPSRSRSEMELFLKTT